MPADEWSDRVLDFASDRSHLGQLAGATHAGEATNLSCGDRIRIELVIAAGRIERAAFTAAGCCLSRAAAAMLCEYLEGRELSESRGMTVIEMFELVGGQLGTWKKRCAVLPLLAFLAAIDNTDGAAAGESLA